MLGSRPKWLLIRPSKTKATSDQTDPHWIVLWLDYRALEAQCALKVRLKTSSDQTILRSKVTPLIRSVCARIRLWSDWKALEIAYEQIKVRSKSPLIRLKCTPVYLLIDWSAFKIVWSENDFQNQQISQYRNILVSWKVMFSIIYSTNGKPILKLLPIKRKPMCQKNLSITLIHVFKWIDELR